jgi:hypothetical protein
VTTLGARRHKVAFAAAVGFVLWHTTAVLVTGAAPGFRDRVWQAFDWYGEGLTLTNTWGMFGKAPRADEVLVVAHRRDGTSYDLSTNWTSRRGGYRRIVDVRLRKIQTQVALADHLQRFGRPFLRYFCREARAEDPEIVRVELRVIQPPGLESAEFNPGTHNLLEEQCAPEGSR